MLVQRFIENKNGRDFVVGDIHGEYHLLDRALRISKFDPARDRVFSVGDLINRGKESKRCIEYLKQPWFKACLGNHEIMFMKLFSKQEDGSISINTKWINKKAGMEWILKQGEKTLLEIYNAFSALPVVMEVQTNIGSIGFVHAEVPSGMNWSTFTRKIDLLDEHALRIATESRNRIKSSDTTPVEGIDRVFHGHTPQKNGITKLGNRFYVDTGAVFRHKDRQFNFALSFAEVTAPLEAMVGLGFFGRVFGRLKPVRVCKP